MNQNNTETKDNTDKDFFFLLYLEKKYEALDIDHSRVSFMLMLLIGGHVFSPVINIVVGFLYLINTIYFQLKMKKLREMRDKEND